MDARLYQTADDGDITVENGQVETAGGLESAVYLSLFGGNEDDDGRQDNPKQFWANWSEGNPDRRYRSETQHLIDGLAAVPANLRRIEDAAGRDLAWLVSAGVASSVTVAATLPARSRLQLVVDIEAIGEETQFTFVENWKASV